MQIIKVPGISSLDKENLNCEKTGNEILECLKKEIFSNESGREINLNKIEIEEIHLDNRDRAVSNELIFNNSFESFGIQDKLFFLGGDHSITFSLARGFFEYCKSENKLPCLIIFDAHANLLFQTEEFPTNRNWLRWLVQDCGFPPASILLIGAGNFQRTEIEFIKTRGIRTISINRIRENIHEISDAIMEFSSGKDLYLSLDFSVLDSVFASSVCLPSSCGLTGGEFLYIMNRMSKMKNLRAVDFVDIKHSTDESNKTIKLASKILGEFL